MNVFVVPCLTATFTQKEAILNFNTLINAFTHIINSGTGHLRTNYSFHFTTSLVCNLNFTKYAHKIVLILPLKPNFCKVNIYLMTEWNQ